MVLTRSQGETTEQEEDQQSFQTRLQAIEEERRRRFAMNPPTSPSDPFRSASATEVPSTSKPPEVPERARSPARSHRSQRSNESATLRQRLAELKAAEKLAHIRRQQLQIEADLVKKRLAVEVASIHDNDSVHDELEDETADRRKVDNWLNTAGAATRGEQRKNEEVFEKQPRRTRFEERRRSPTPERSRGDIEQLAEAIEKMARPRPRHASELPTFSGAPSEWLPFKAAMRDSTSLYRVSSAENVLRLRNSLKGEARDAVAALLHTATDPDTIMTTLEQSFGRPELIIDRAMEELKRLPKPGSSATDLNTFAVKVQNVVCVLKTIDKRGYLFNPMLVREILEKLSPHIKSRWCDFAEDYEPSAEPELVKMSRFLMREADRALKYTYAPAASTSSSKEQKPTTAASKKRGNAVYTVDDTEQLDGCPKCSQPHNLHQCPAYRALTVSQRWDLVREKGLCFRCVEKKHRRFRCKAKLCGVNQCRRPHHPTLHEDANPSTTTSTEPAARSAAQPAPTEPDHTAAVLSVAPRTTTESKAALLKICPVIVSGPRGEVSTYALLDEGATITLVDEKLAKEVGAQGPSQPLHLCGVNMTQREQESKIVTLSLRGRSHNELQVRARTIRDLKLHRQTIPSSMLEHDHLRDIKEELCYEQARPLILVGMDHWEVIVSRELRVGGPDQPAASRTQLGWVVHGTVPRRLIHRSESVLHIFAPEHRDHENNERRLHELVESHFRIDALGITHKPRVSEADQRATNIVESTMKKIDGGYEVGLPWRQDNVTMPPSYDLALRRLKSIERKMDADPAFAEAYTAQVNNLLTKGYAAPCDGTERQSPVCWYLPHFAVRNPNKPGKPPRLVFDAAQKCNGVSLNDQLLEGPDLLNSLPGILFRFREKPVAVTADIQEMFLRIRIQSADQPAQMFLWRGADRTSPPRKYKMKSLIFGAASSPFIAHSVRDHNARMHAETHPRALKAITKSHYMDDLVDSYPDHEEAQRTIREIREVHAAAGFTLRGWSANEGRVLRDVPNELRATTPTQLGADYPENKILGLWWDARKDILGFNTSMQRVPAEIRVHERAPTKREALSAVMSIYDPLGLLSSYTIRAKIMLQGLWRLKLGWDEPIPLNDAEDFYTWLQQLSNVAQLRLPRCYALNPDDRVELHVFCDASEQAYATVAYWRATQDDDVVKTALVAAKAKVAPRRTQSIPRLELQAAVIGARLAHAIKTEHRIEVIKTTYWTDSATVVHWIRNDTRRYTPFVAHRLGEIGELTHKEEWRWLPTNHNVADDATRHGHTTIAATDRWFQGPDFLLKPEREWPSGPAPTEDEEEVLHTSAQDNKREDWLPDPARFSKYERLVRAAARVLAFIDICRRRATRLEHEHIQRAERAILQRAQEDSFESEIKKIEATLPIPKTSRLYKLDPMLEDGLLRVRGRIAASSAPMETKRPIIMDGRHHITKLLVMREHCAAGHANRERVANDLRQRYWVIHLRPTIRAIEHRCALCRVRKATPRTPPAGDLPRARLDPFHRPFTNCGVDYFGPMMVKVGRRREKRWCALFTCLTVRAIHLELVASLTTDSAIMALRRMAARRGWPSAMFSDNATNFRGADSELRAAYAEWAPALREHGLLHRMKWTFIPPGAPNQGGAWERMVRSVKAALKATLREKAPTEEILRTLLTEAEHSVNARPLTHVSVSPRDPEALTPNHFLLGSSMGLPTTGPCDEADRRTWRASQGLADHFWRRWLREYLPTLVPRGQPTSSERKLQEDDVVAVVDPSLPRNVWPLGIVTRTYAGPDGDVRVADVKTKAGVFKRPITRLVVLVKKEEATHATPGGEL